MGFHDTVQNSFKGMIKSSGYVKHFRHQCTTLIQICRDLWALVSIAESEEYQSFQKFVAIANQALQAVAGFDKPPSDKPWDEKQLQGKLDQAILDLEEYCGTLSGFEKYNPQALMLEARIKDEKRSLRIAAVDKLKKIPEIKSQVTFYIHDGSGPHQLLSLNISKKSTSEEILFKLGRNPSAKIKLHESAHFYTGPDITIKGAMQIKLGSGPSTYRSKEGFSDFKAYFDSVERGPVHVFVDRNPSIHILLTTKKWSRLFSLARLIDNDKTMVLKSVDGSLYHAQQVVGQLILSSTGVGVFQLDRATNLKTRTQAGLTASDCIGILREARGFIVAEGRRLNKYGGWLIEVQPSSSEPFDGSTKPKIEYRKGISRNLLLDFSPSTGNVAGNSAQAVSHGASTGADATTRVKEMVKKFEQEKKDTEKREKERGEKKGFFGRVFGK